MEYFSDSETDEEMFEFNSSESGSEMDCEKTDESPSRKGADAFVDSFLNFDQIDMITDGGYPCEKVIDEYVALLEKQDADRQRLMDETPVWNEITEPVDWFGSSVTVDKSTSYKDGAEAAKFEAELAQRLKDTPVDNSPRRISLEWRHKLLVTVVVGMGLIPTTWAEKSTPENYADATSTLLWAIGCLFVLYKFGKCFETLSVCMLMLSAGMAAWLTAMTQLITTLNGIIPALIVQITSLITWWKYSVAAQTVIQGLGTLGTYMTLPFTIWSTMRGATMRPEGRGAFKTQGANKYGVLASAIMATLMFIAVPIWGFSKSFKYWEPVMRVLEKLPYVTWLIDWVRAYCAGEVGVDSIPTTVRDFADGKETPVGGSSIFDYPTSDGSAHVVPARKWEGHDLDECAAHVILGDQCGNDCFCSCHADEETKEAREVMGEGLESPTYGLGSDASHAHERNVNVLRKSMLEPIESRKERLSKIGIKPVPFVKGEILKVTEKGKEKEKQPENAESVPVVKTRLCRDCKKALEPTSIVVCDACLEEKKKALDIAKGINIPMESQGFLPPSFEHHVQEAWKAVRDVTVKSCGDAYKFVADHKTGFYVALAALGVAASVAYTFMKEENDEWTFECAHPSTCPMMPATADAYNVCNTACGGVNCSHWVGCNPEKLEGKNGKNSNKIRYRAPTVKAVRQQRRFDHLETGGSESESDFGFEHSDEEEEIFNSRAGRRRAQDDRDGWVSEGKIAEKSAELGMKYFPEHREPKVVANVNRIVRSARTKRYSYYPADVEKVRRISKTGGRMMHTESLLGKAKMTWARVSGNVYKFYQDGQFTSTAAVIGNKVHVPLHSHVDGVVRKIVNPAASAIVGGEITPTSEDGGVFFHNGTVKATAMILRAPKNEAVMLVSYSSAEQIEPTLSVGYASADGLANYASESGDCGGLVIAVSDGAIVGTHIAGGLEVNRFEPVTEERIARWKSQNAASLTSMLFQ